MQLSILNILLALVVVYVLYKLVYKRENFDETPVYASIGTILGVAVIAYILFNVFQVKKILSLGLVH